VVQAPGRGFEYERLWIVEKFLDVLEGKAQRVRFESPGDSDGVEAIVEMPEVAVSEMSRQLKQLAGELRCPVVAFSQLSRGLEQRQDKRPMLAELRELGEIEQDAGVVAFLYREEVYNKDSSNNGIAGLIVAKNRHGRTGTVKIAWLPHYTKCADLSFAS